ncbi:FAD-binding oxidoreductase [Phyllobacterium sp. 0TCS1.6C]|uniref:FAD-binding oxidoreductase n=1 Tax=unclassified Phyllobacterium TaxID=2638441 RepID=UPI0022643C41|nr:MULTISPECIES: FAD-binding oxidoreductase [unclassified Phyllobacterium]MCX8279511.1 FAD-binding oxidoreductase [Phyllobacterium sp. 0TCS1.6C]MCX8292298.1 FAD-binding oxidoreductase [Phyllobacterium sp. 0TCS1.6A]
MSGPCFDSFGRIRRQLRKSVSLDKAREIFLERGAGSASYLAYGNGRSYGDSCHNDAGSLVDMRDADALIHFDANTGLLTAQAGMLLSQIIAIAAPHGYFLPVTPGTRFVTLGGAIANDVHGKNHHRQGTFGRHVENLELLRSDGTVSTCSETSHAELFAATIGGLGLTGIILSATVKLMRVGSLDILERITPFNSLEDYFAMASEADLDNEYAVAWVDQLASGATSGRGVLITGNHAEKGGHRTPESPGNLGVPFETPVSVLNYPSLKLFNMAYFWMKSRKTEPHMVGYGSFFYPLDQLRNWNRLYGTAGLFQHQSVIPEQAALATIPEMLKATRDAGQSSFLTVLKRFGDVASPGLLSFPQPGYTLTVDFPNRGQRTLALLKRLDDMTIDAGGRINPYKDQRMSSHSFKRGFPMWDQLETWRDPAIMSNFWARTALAS